MWTQPICADCWCEENPGSHPTTLKTADYDRCCMCGTLTSDGIYIRRDPRSVAYLAKDD